MPVQRESIDSLRYPTETFRPNHIELVPNEIQPRNRRTQTWDREYSDVSEERLKELRSIVGSLFIQDRKAVKRKTGDECWETHLRISRLNVKKV
ncbi:hypothetical protein FVEN_g12630 [Fusarium venenatum]|nr:hypothetical protein FVEN_g12630 [Fusarium venenatum]